MISVLAALALCALLAPPVIRWLGTRGFYVLALAPAGAAEAYGLSILRNDLQDSGDNRTRFVLLSLNKG